MSAHGLQITLTRHQKAAAQIGADHRLPAFRADRLQRHHVLAAGVVHQAVDAPVRGDDGRHRAHHQLLLADVADMASGSATIRADLSHHLLQLVGTATQQHDVGAERRQLVRHAAPNARAATGDDNHPAGEQRASKH